MANTLYRFVMGGILGGLLAAPLAAQEGHPFDGTWRGTLENDAGDTRRVVLIMKYDGENVGGMINPGRNSLTIQSAELDAPNWLLTVRAQSPSGPLEFSGTLHEIGAPDRYMTGTWIEGGEEYDFRVSRE